MRETRFATYTVDNRGHAEWTLNDGVDAPTLEADLIRAAASWTPPVTYSVIVLRPLTGAERRRTLTDAGALVWWEEHNPVPGPHPACPPTAHDRSLPDPIDGQAVARDGNLACNDCGRPAYYCERDSSYHHLDPAAACFLIAAG